MNLTDALELGIELADKLRTNPDHAVAILAFRPIGDGSGEWELVPISSGHTERERNQAFRDIGAALRDCGARLYTIVSPARIRDDANGAVVQKAEQVLVSDGTTAMRAVARRFTDPERFGQWHRSEPTPAATFGEPALLLPGPPPTKH